MSAMDTAPVVSDPHTFADLVGDDQHLVRVAVTDAHEGPVYVPEDGALYFTSVPAPASRSSGSSCPGEVTVLRADANKPPTAWRSHPDGRLLVCEQGSLIAPARISRRRPRDRRGRDRGRRAGAGCR